MIKKVLIANRGEIAVRIIRACREMGIETVAVYSEADREALHTQLADEAVCIGPASSAESYLNMERIISATIISGADAVHPGFGFLSENSQFARLCEQCQITFIGPDADTIERLGNKSQARNTMIQAGVPVIPGSKEALYEPEEAVPVAAEVGYPVIVKAALGGGGKGMRVAADETELRHAFCTAQKEAVAAFGDGTMYLEHFVQRPRHIEFQILADKYGHVIHLGERDCSLQRNHQKLVEESPSPALSEALREQMGKAAVTAARVSGYENAGTIEFLLEPDGKFYFMEMNTRIQVEHPISEMISGVDIVKQQIKVAGGQKLTLKQEDIKQNGYALECRINAEDVERNFAPSGGKINFLHIPGGRGIRVDSAVYTGYEIPPFYDSMILKLITFAPTRLECIKKMRVALEELIIDGVKTNIEFHYLVLHNKTFIEGKYDTGFFEEFIKELEEQSGELI